MHFLEEFVSSIREEYPDLTIRDISLKELYPDLVVKHVPWHYGMKEDPYDTVEWKGRRCGKILGRSGSDNRTYVSWRRSIHYAKKVQGYGIQREIALALGFLGIKSLKVEYRGERENIDYISPISDFVTENELIEELIMYHIKKAKEDEKEIEMWKEILNEHHKKIREKQKKKAIVLCLREEDGLQFFLREEDFETAKYK